MRSLFAPYTSLVIPTGAGAGNPRTVIGQDIPAELVAYAAAVPVVGPLTLTSATLSYDAAGNYSYRAFGRHTATRLAEISGFVTAAGVVHPLTYADFDIPSGNRLNYLNAGPGTYPGTVFVEIGDAFYTSLLGGDIDAADITSSGQFNANIPVCRMFRTTAQSIPDGGTGTAISWSTADLDSHGGWDPTTPTRYTIQQSGVYRFDWGVAFATNATGTRYGYMRRGGTAAGIIQRWAGVSGNPSTGQGVHIEEASAGDYYELLAAQGSGGPLNTAAQLVVPVTIPYLYVTRVRGLVP